jgi:murein DD-endopeptidase MepM/ murein hydrolase activator NlpD
MTTTDDFNASQMALGKLTVSHVTELVRFWQAHQQPPLAIDGLAGPQTIASLDAATAGSPWGRPPAPFLRCPLPQLADGRLAVVTSSFRPPDRLNHDGCDWFYSWVVGDKPDFVGDHGAAGKTPAGKPKWVVPTGTLAIAAASGKIQLASDSATGHRVWVDHGNGWRTGYFHLLDLRVKVGDVVSVGAPLGLVGDNPADNDGRHLHFELSPVDRYEPTDPQLCLLPR